MAWVILVVFLICAGLMYTRRLPALLALPLMALAIAWLSAPGHPLDAVGLVFGTGSTRLAGAMTNAIFGAMLAVIVQTCGIAETLVRRVAELAGDRAVPVALTMMLATALAFLALGGLGAVIMVGTLVLPIMVGVGIRPLAAACIFLFGVSIGGLWNVGGWGLYHDVFKLPVSSIFVFATINGVCLFIAAVAYVLVNGRARRSTWAVPAADSPKPQSLPIVALITPVLPIVLMLAIQWHDRRTGGNLGSMAINGVLLFSALYGVICTRPREVVNLMARGFTEGVTAVAPVLALMIGIGMVVTALTAPPVTAALQPVLHAILPRSRWGYVVFFGLLSPLALYRGPLNLYGLGAGIATILSTILAPRLTMGALMGTGLVQGVCDPTNTMNVWTGSFTKTDVNDILKSTLPYTMAATLAALIVIAATQW